MQLKGADGESRVHQVDGKYLSSPGATPEMVAGINRFYPHGGRADAIPHI